jgi:hypothetical protein
MHCGYLLLKLLACRIRLVNFNWTLRGIEILTSVAARLSGVKQKKYQLIPLRLSVGSFNFQILVVKLAFLRIELSCEKLIKSLESQTLKFKGRTEMLVGGCHSLVQLTTVK